MTNVVGTATMVAVRKRRQATALLTLAALLAPSAFGLIVCVHLSTRHAADHREDGHDDEAAFSVVWHGHSHATTTPRHDHPFLLAGTRALRVPAALQLTSDAPCCWPYTALSSARAYRVWRLRPPDLAGVGPPQCAERISILRI